MAGEEWASVLSADCRILIWIRQEDGQRAMEGRSKGGVERDPAKATPELHKVTWVLHLPRFRFRQGLRPWTLPVPVPVPFLQPLSLPSLSLWPARERTEPISRVSAEMQSTSRTSVSFPSPASSPPCCLRFPNLTFNLAPPPRLALPSPSSFE